MPYTACDLRFARLAASALLSTALMGGAPVLAQQEGITAEGWRQVGLLAQKKAGWTPTQRKIASALLLEIDRQRGDRLFDELPRLRAGAEVDEDGNVLVDIAAEVTPGLLAEIAARDGTVVSSSPRFGAVRARLPLEALEALAAAAEVRRIRPADRAINNKVNTSQGDVAHAAAPARPLYGVTGAGIKIGVLSDGVDTRAARQASGDLPPLITVLPGQAGSGDEGTAMLEIVYDLAPGAELFFATAFSGQESFAQNILDLAAAGCDVIVDDIFYPAEPVFQDGVIAQAVETVALAGVHYFSAAGNSGNKNDGTSGVWEGDYLPTTVPAAIPPGYDSAHDFGGTPFDTITFDPPFRVTLHWSDASGASANDYDLYLLDPTGSTVEAVGLDIQDGNGDPFEIFTSEGFNDLDSKLVVVRESGADRYLHLNTIRGRIAISTAGQTAGHAATENGFGVAAVDVAEAGGEVFSPGPGTAVEAYSSDGPRRVFFDADGNPFTPGNLLSTGGELLEKPDFAGADCVATATPGFGTFCGTSAAAPHAAAIAALLEEIGDLTPTGMRQILGAAALDIEAAGIDRDSGYGVLEARRAVRAVSPSAGACGAGDVDDIVLDGTPNDGPLTVRACDTLTVGGGRFDNFTGRAQTLIFTDGFESGDTSVWSNTSP